MLKSNTWKKMPNCFQFANLDDYIFWFLMISPQGSIWKLAKFHPVNIPFILSIFEPFVPINHMYKSSPTEIHTYALQVSSIPIHAEHLVGWI